MKTEDYLAHLADDGPRLRQAAARAPAAPVPSCPEWDATGLVVHTSAVHHWVIGIVEAGAADRPDRTVPDGLADDWEAAAAWYDEGLERLLGTLAAADPQATVWNFVDGGLAEAAFWWRRMAQETSVHRFDAELAAHQAGAGPAPTPAPDDLAADAVGEVAAMIGARLRYRAREGLEGALGLAPEQGGEGWTYLLAPDSVTVVPGVGSADDVVAAPMADLALWLVGRQAPDRPAPRIEGPGTVAAAWAAIRF